MFVPFFSALYTAGYEMTLRRLCRYGETGLLHDPLNDLIRRISPVSQSDNEMRACNAADERKTVPAESWEEAALRASPRQRQVRKPGAELLSASQ